jgi:hypothetical protein
MAQSSRSQPIRRSSLARASSAWLVLFFLGACESGATCKAHDECVHDEELGTELGRCAPQEFFCDDGECKGWCRQSCVVVSERINPCSQPGLICSQTEEQQDGMCQGRAIPCEAAADCPIYRPRDAGSWECVGGMCRFPGFEYALR